MMYSDESSMDLITQIYMYIFTHIRDDDALKNYHCLVSNKQRV